MTNAHKIFVGTSEGKKSHETWVHKVT